MHPSANVRRNLILPVVVICGWLSGVAWSADPLFERAMAAPNQPLPPIRAITRGPKFHWFGYYDKLQFDPKERYVLGMEVDFEGRSPTVHDVVKIGMIDLQNDDKWIELGASSAWCWQQGCMLQWRPGSPTEILWNDRHSGRFVCHILDVKTRGQRTLPHAIHNVSPDGKWALGVDFARVGRMRPGYGYAGVDDPYVADNAPENSGVYRVDLETGESTLVVSLAQLAKVPTPGVDVAARGPLYVNHVQVSPDGRRFLFLCRDSAPDWGKYTRMFTAAADGSDLRVVNVGASHYVWRDPQHILIWVGSYQLFKDDESLRGETLWEAPNGHQSYLPGNEWIVTDTYPLGKERKQHVYLFHAPTRRIVPLGHFPSPSGYDGEWRCDTHPRLSPDGSKVVIDSPHGGNGRQMYLIDIHGVAAGNGERASD